MLQRKWNFASQRLLVSRHLWIACDLYKWPLMPILHLYSCWYDHSYPRVLNISRSFYGHLGFRLHKLKQQFVVIVFTVVVFVVVVVVVGLLLRLWN